MIIPKQTKQGQKFKARVKVNGRLLSKTFDTEKDAQAWIDTQRRRRGNGSFRYERVTIDMLFKLYKDSALNRGNAISSIEKVEGIFENHLKPYYQRFNLLNISIREHEKFLTYLREKDLNEDDDSDEEKHLGPETINRIRALISTMFNVAIRTQAFGEGIITYNPFLAVPKMRSMNKKLEFWTSDKVAAFLTSEEKSHYYPLWILMLNTGLRVGEAVALHGEQVDLKSGFIAVDRIWCTHSNGIRRETKGCRIRNVAMNKGVIQAIEPIYRDGLIFANEDGSPIRGDYVYKTLLKEACARAKVPFIGCHGLRHTFASNFVMNGGSLYDLQKILGHSDIKTTSRYAHFSMDHVRSTARIVEFVAGNVIHGNFARTTERGA